MKWTLEDPNFGDIIRVKLGDIYHYGIYASDEEIIQFGLPLTNFRRDPSSVEVCITDLDTFLCGKFFETEKCERKEKKTRKTPQETVENARKRIGEKGYHILYNNCEHFVYQCAFGKTFCSQVDGVRDMWRNFPFVNVYVRKIPFETNSNDIYPKDRQIEIDKCSNQKVKEEKYYVWKLLEYGLNHSLGLKMKDVKFSKIDTKWVCDKCQFSLSHSNGIVAVAVARNEVGIDIEEINLDKFAKIKSEKILTLNELVEFENLSETEKLNYLNKIWTIKEAVFKEGKDKSFLPNKTETKCANFVTKKISVEGHEFYLSVSTKNKSLIKFNLSESAKIE